MLRVSPIYRLALLAAAIVSAAVTVQPVPAQAQNLFETLFNVLGGRRSLYPDEDKSTGVYQSYCVRLCDGRFFPLPAADRERDRFRERSFFFRDYRDRDDRRTAPVTTGQASPDNLCKAMCPATPVRVFTGAGIDNAVAADGTSYTRLQNAFVYREKMVDECSCNGIENIGITNIEAETDPTLQPGDIIVTEEGAKVYRGAQGRPTPASFVPVSEYRGMSPAMRKNLSEMRITRVPEPVTARAGIAPGATGPAAENPGAVAPPAVGGTP